MIVRSMGKHRINTFLSDLKKMLQHFSNMNRWGGGIRRNSNKTLYRVPFNLDISFLEKRKQSLAPMTFPVWAITEFLDETKILNTHYMPPTMLNALGTLSY